ncbi:MAG: thioesterase domain-containing protein [Planctomycetota bacterium]|nr:thioesterase domain-containing protein [Planctomycetota bacterium]
MRAWSGVLKAGAVEPDANFFDLGGDSIMAAQFINDLQELAEETFHAVALFDAPTAGQFAAMLRKDYPRTTAALLKRLGAGDAWAGTRAQADEPPVDEAMLAALRALIPALPKQPPRPPARKNPRAVFVLSPPRCGSTLLRVMLAGHPGLFAPPELELLNFDSLGARREYCAGPLAGKLEGLLRALMDLKGVDAEAARALMTPYEDRDLDTGSFFGELQGWLGGRLLVDKTPAYALDLHALERAEACFEAPRYVHLNRHPYGMTLSFEESRIDQVFFRVAHPFGVRRLAELIWNVCTENIRTFLANVPAARQMLLRYEDLVADPRARMLELSDFMQVPFDERMLTPYEGKEAKMTDGLHAVSRMIGDPKFHKHKSIDARMADRWREAYDRDFLGEVTWRNARALGYAREAPSGKPAAEPAGAEAQPPLSTSVVPIKRSGTKRAFFCVHPAGGSVYSFGTLVKHFDPERPIYGLQAKGVEDLEDAELHSSIEEMAAYYAEVVRSVQPEGPYLIGGRCMGGIIAFEMARRLADLGFAVPYVALLDTRNLLSSRKKHAQDPIPVKLKRFIRHFDLARKVRKWKKRRAEREALKEASPTQRRIQDLKSIHKKARRTYEAEPYAGAVTLYHNSSDTREKTYIAHWQAVAPNLECVEIRGSHVSMFQEPHIRDLAAEMARGMDRVDAQALAGRRS